MASAATDLIRTIAPQMDSISDDDVDEWVGIAAQQLSAQRWGALYVQAAANLTVHLMVTLGGLPNSGGPSSSAPTGALTSRRAGDLAEGYANLLSGLTLEEAELAQTRYGLRFLAIRRSRFRSGPSVVTL